MQFNVKVHYFNRNLVVIVDDNWADIIKDIDRKNGIKGKDYTGWTGGFFVRNNTPIICLEKNPSIAEIVHEVVHFVNDLFIEIGYQPELDNDEIQCYLISYFSEKIYKKVYDIKKIK